MVSAVGPDEAGSAIGLADDAALAHGSSSLSSMWMRIPAASSERHSIRATPDIPRDICRTSWAPSARSSERFTRPAPSLRFAARLHTPDAPDAPDAPKPLLRAIALRAVAQILDIRRRSTLPARPMRLSAQATCQHDLIALPHPLQPTQCTPGIVSRCSLSPATDGNQSGGATKQACIAKLARPRVTSQAFPATRQERPDRV